MEPPMITPKPVYRRPALSVREQRDVLDLSLPEQRAYWRARRRENHDNAIQSAIDYAAEQQHREV